MKVKSMVVNSACRLGGLRLARTLTGRQPRILMYHRFSQDEQPHKVPAVIFDRQLAELKKNFNVQPLSSMCDTIRNGGTLPPHSIAITIDDGYDDFYRVAYPLLRKHGLPSTVYVTSGFVDRQLWLWPDKISFLLRNTSKQNFSVRLGEYAPVELPLATTAARDAAWSRLVCHCLLLADVERLAFIDRLSADLGVTLHTEPASDYAPMSWSAIREISDNGVEVGAHSATHPVLSRIDPARLRDEILGCRMRIEQMISKPVLAFCYPNGQPDDLNEQVKQMVIKSGFANATVAFHDRHGWQDLYAIRRYGVGEDMLQFRKALYGVEYLSDTIH